MTNKKRKHDGDSAEESEIQTLDQTTINSITYDEEGGMEIDDIYVPPLPKPPTSIDVNGPRLIITKIVNMNFKSYGETQILGPFHKYFNAIVGPNGSGKSNVIDSMLFVFGYRASKIRSKKLSVLLHKSEKYQNVQSCTVSIHFALIRDKVGDLDKYEEIPGSEFVVSRTANKDNSSYYQINRSKVQYKEVALLLRKHGVDLDHNRFLILQGEVEQISLMKPKAQSEHETGMLEYLEDIIGTFRFKEPLAKIDEKIEFLTEQRSEKLNRVALAEKEKDDFKEPMLAAVNFLKLENEIMKKKNFLYQRQIKKVKDKLLEVEENKAKVVSNFEELKENLANILKDKATREEAFKEENKKYESLSKRKEQISESFNVANNQDENLLAEIMQINNRRKKLIESIKKEKSALEDLEKVPERNKRDIDECTKRQEQLIKEQEKLEADRNKALASLRDDTIALQEKKEQFQTELVDLRKVVDESKAAFSIAESKLKLYTSGEESERKKLESLKTELQENKAKLSQHTETTKELKKQIPLTEKQLKDAQTELQQVKVEEARVLAQLRVQRVEVEERRNSMQANRSRGRVLDSLMREKHEGRLPGLFGRLGDLGAIDEKYDVAISTACRALDNIVVDTVDTAQWCIEFLRANNIGRATFLALEKQEYLQHQANSTITTPENIPRLFDLVRIEDTRLRTAFYYALRDTLVARDLDQASRTAYGARRYRVVTLSGDIIETSGTMCGGGGSVSRGRIGRQVACKTTVISPRKMEEMQESLVRLEERVRELHTHQGRLEDQLNTLQTSLNNMQVDLEKASIEYQSLHHQMPQLQAQLKKQEQIVKTTTTNPAELKKLQTVVDNKNEEYEKAKNDADVIQAQVDNINKQIKEKTDKKMGSITKRLKECTDLLEKIKQQIVKLKVAIKTSDRNAKRSEDKIASMEQEKLDCENKLRNMQEKRQEIEKDAAIMLEKIEKITQELANGQDEFSEQRKAIEKLTEKANKLKAEKIEFDQNIFSVDKVIKENKDILHQTQHKLSQIRLQEVPEETTEELRMYTDEELMETDTRHMEIELKTEEEKARNAKPNLTAIKEYQKKAANYIQRAKELDEISEKRTQMRQLRDDLRKKRYEEFYAGFNVIASKLKEMYQMITLGGDAELEMVDNYDPFSEGVVLNVRPPKKSWKNITNLSGGEKTLSSLSLVFALHYYKPSPLYFMDEIDAALDFKNVSIVGNYIKERTKNTQFIIISLRSNMFELADHLIGIFKTYNITKSITINPRIMKNINNIPCLNASSENNNPCLNQSKSLNESGNASQPIEDPNYSQSKETQSSQESDGSMAVCVSSQPIEEPIDAQPKGIQSSQESDAQTNKRTQSRGSGNASQSIGDPSDSQSKGTQSSQESDGRMEVCVSSQPIDSQLSQQSEDMEISFSLQPQTNANKVVDRNEKLLEISQPKETQFDTSMEISTSQISQSDSEQSSSDLQNEVNRKSEELFESSSSKGAQSAAQSENSMEECDTADNQSNSQELVLHLSDL